MSVKLQPHHRRINAALGDEVVITGVDPGLHGAAVATIRATVTGMGLATMGLRLHDLRMARTPKGLKGEDAVVAMRRVLPRAVEESMEQGLMALTPRVGWHRILVVEGQGVHSGSTPDPRPIIHLAHISGLAISALEEAPDLTVYMPQFSQWAGTLKDTSIFQARAWRDMGVSIAHLEKRAPSDPYIVPRPVANEWARVVNEGDFKHLGDAVGMAVWGLKVAFRLETHGRAE